MKTGIALIAEERKRQIKVEGWSAEHDDEHEYGEMALVACAYASPLLLYGFDKNGDSLQFNDPFIMTDWDSEWDKRQRDEDDNLIANEDLPIDKRVRNLVKAGALIAAEIDRLQRAQKNE